MKKIGIAAVTYKDNFGSALQTYATQYIIEKLGYEARIFEIKGVHRNIKIKKTFYYVSRMLEPVELRYLIENLKSRSRKQVSVSTDLFAQNMRIRHKMYVDFNDRWFKMLPTKKSWRELNKQAAGMDAVVVGSDQLWRPSNIVGCYYTLEFVPDKIRKVAYSTSFGVSEIPKCLHKHTRLFLNRINYISVRENSGAKIVKEMIGRNVPVVCDPTMLLDAETWMHIQEKKPFAEEKYILCYFMGNNPEHREFAKRLREKTGYKIIALLHGATFIASDEDFADETPYNVGPSEFINLIRNAQYVCTDSFHGTVFSILNSRSFFSFRRWPEGSKFSANDRLYTLLKFTGLGRRMLYGNEDIETCINDDIDYECVLKKVETKRKESLKYLIDSLKD